MGVDRIGVLDNFFELGGHSLLATRLVSMVRRQMDVDLAIRDVFVHPTISELGGHISGHSTGVLLPSIVPYDRSGMDRVPLSYSQERLWFIDQLQGSLEYHIPFVLRLEGTLDRTLLADSLREIVSRHEVLRTVILSDEGVGHQEVLPSEDWALEYYDAVERSDVEGYLSLFLSRAFDLSKDYMLRVGLYRLGEAEHILAGAFHHIASDGWSNAILINEFVALYGSKKSGLPHGLPALGIQYSDYALWQREHISGSFLEEQLSYWEGHLKDVSALILPTDRPRSPQVDSSGGSLSFELPPDLSASIHGRCQEEGVTLFMFLLAAFKVLLYRYSGQNDICVGTSVANRTQQELEGLIGFFVNTLALRSDVSGNTAFRSFLSQVKRTTLDAYEHQHAPFEKIVDRTVKTRDMATSPLFQVAFALQHAADEAGLEMEGLSLEFKDITEHTSKFDITLTATELDTGIAMNIEYRSSLFDRSTMERMASHYRGLLEGIVLDLDRSVGSIPMLTSEELTTVLEDFQGPEVVYDSEKTLVDLFEEQARSTPEHVALVYQDRTLTYRELDRRSNQLARYLKGQGSGPEALVGICIERSLEMVIGILGILKSGGAYVPMDPDYPSQRIGYMLEDSQIRLLLSSSGSIENVPDLDHRTVLLDRDWGTISQQSTRKLSTGPSQENLAYVIYTSGSTGQPKGVMIEHHSIRNLVVSQIAIFNVTAESSVLQFASFGFDASCSELFTTLLTGASLIVPTKEELLSTTRAVDLMNTHKVDVVTLPPSYQVLLKDMQVPSLRTIISAGESLNIPVTKHFQSQGIRIVNFYGPTENTIGTSMSENPILSNGLSTIGKPISNTRLYIVSEDTALCPIGIVGELCISGSGLSRGYLNRPDLTASKFVPNPFSGIEGDLMYRTGDLARWLPDGNIEFIGRADHQVKIRGYRIELGEIENTILKLDSISQAAVLIKKNSNGDDYLAAYLQSYKTPKLRASISEYFVYDDLAYHALTTDTKRNNHYKEVFKRYLKDKIVLDIGSGPEAILSQFCIEAGADKVYSVEISKEVYEKAKKHIEKKGLSDKIILINDDITKVTLPEKVDYCVSEIVGPIGGSEGAAKLINASRKLLKSPQNMLPKRSVTKVAGVCFPENLHDYKFDTIGKHYVEKIFDKVGYKFDLRLCVEDFSSDNVITTDAVFEDLDFTQPLDLEGNHNIRLEFTKSSQITGFLVWLNLFIDEDIWLDTLSEKYSWLPVYLPVFKNEIKVKPGDYIEAQISRRLSDNDLNPDFTVSGSLFRKNTEKIDFKYKSVNHEKLYRHNSFYEKLFEHDTVQVSKQVPIGPTQLTQHLKQHLPEYMIPGVWVELDAIPLTANGKIDREALPDPDRDAYLTREYVPPRDEIEQDLAGIWSELLGVDSISVLDDFFALGGHSLLATRLVSMVRVEMEVEIAIRDVFTHSVLEELATHISGISKGVVLPQIVAVEDKEFIPLSYSQERLWFLDQLQGSVEYHFRSSYDWRVHRPGCL
ncbi:amino acid adenylation domain-containing protein [Muricauda sp. SCSIO 64092]|uniref:non-ribosomal peptide synthetase n=1 Tax=Allomuricauda sp. SCSIO 64092 TaxID=2908842 RepID=UPI001FF668C9|nr:non-ribosomal peptide synthetase [Muricauda sp. SCSIO 64092]UOY09327.1 amino acid adenylation domain-containing protein [Muricauda sp. SCSIO 64092]